MATLRLPWIFFSTRLPGKKKENRHLSGSPILAAIGCFWHGGPSGNIRLGMPSSRKTNVEHKQAYSLDSSHMCVSDSSGAGRVTDRRVLGDLQRFCSSLCVAARETHPSSCRSMWVQSSGKSSDL